MGYYDTYDYMYDYGTTADAAGVTVMLIYLGVLLVWGLFALVSYVIKAVGIYTIAKREGAEYPWLAFVPFARTYLQGELGGEIVLKKKSIRNPGIWLLVLPFVTAAVAFVFYIILFAVIGFSMFSYSATGYGSGMGAGSVLLIVVLVILFVAVLVVFSAAQQVLKVLVNHQILRKFTSKNLSIAHAVLMGVIPLYEAICFLIMSRKPYNPGMEPPSARPFMQAPPEGPNPFMGGPALTMPGMPKPGQEERPVPPVNAPEPPKAMKPNAAASEQPGGNGSGFVPQRGLLNPEAKPERKPEVQPEVKLEQKPEVQPEVKTEPKVEIQPEMMPETVVQPAGELHAEPKSEPVEAMPEDVKKEIGNE